MKNRKPLRKWTKIKPSQLKIRKHNISRSCCLVGQLYMAPHIRRESKIAIDMLKELAALLRVSCEPLVPSAILENRHRAEYLLEELHQSSIVLFFPLVLGLVLAMYKLTRVLDLNGRLSSVISESDKRSQNTAAHVHARSCIRDSIG